MDPSLRSAAICAARRVQAAWADAPAGRGTEPRACPDLAALLRDLPPQAVLDAVIADAEERWDRGLPATLAHYADILAADLLTPELHRAVLMCEVARRDREPIERIGADLRARHPGLESDIEAVLALAELTRSAESQAADSSAEQTPLGPGASVGKYVLVRALGRGSFGEVWQARDTELNRYIALKLLFSPAAAVDRDAAAPRFIDEARAAAALDHEHIVAVHHAGIVRTDSRDDTSARFYIDSQLVADPDPVPDDPIRVAVGRSLEDERASPDTPCATPRRAAEIVEAIARAIAAAHARGILHRDLKPANILLTPSGKPMVADFGLSVSGVFADGADRSNDPSRTIAITDASSGLRIVGTPAYMAPEQARAEPATPLTDVFALGAILRFLLTGAAPYAPSGRHSPDARLDVVAQARAAQLPALRSLHSRRSTARSDAASPAPITRVHPTLAAVADKAMAPRPADRYVSAEQLAADLRAFLSHRPTIAAGTSAPGALALWYRRNLLPVSIALAALALVAILTTRFIHRIEGERDRARAAELTADQRRIEAELARDDAAAVNRFMTEIFVSAVPGQPGVRRDPRLSDVLTSAARRADSLADRPLAEANVRAILGQSLMNLSRPAEARPHIERSLAIRRERLGPEHPDTLRSRRVFAQIEQHAGRSREALDELRALAEINQRVLGPDNRETIIVLDTISTIHELLGELDEARSVLDTVIARRERSLGPDHIETIGARSSLSHILARKRDYPAAISIARGVVESLRARSDIADGVILARATQDLGAILRDAGQPDEAEPLFRRAISDFTATLGPDHITTLNAEHNLALLLMADRRQPDLALPLLRRAAETAARTHSSDYIYTIVFRKNLAHCLMKLGQRDEAFEILAAAHASAARTLGENHAETREIAGMLARTAHAPAAGQQPQPPR